MKGIESMKWNINIKLERPDEFKKEDESWFDSGHMESEIGTWLEDLDYTIEKITITKDIKK